MILACYDCGLPYKSPRFADFVVPDAIWERISPTGDEGGILCAACILGKLTLLGIECDGRFTSGPCAQHDWVKPKEISMTYWDELEVKARELFETTARQLRANAIPWSELPEETRDVYRRELVRRLADSAREQQ